MRRVMKVELDEINFKEGDIIECTATLDVPVIVKARISLIERNSMDVYVLSGEADHGINNNKVDLQSRTLSLYYARIKSIKLIMY